MTKRILTMFAASMVLAGSAAAQGSGGLGTEEFGLTTKQLVQAVEKVEAEIAKCMRAEGFQYIAADYLTIRRGMSADKRLPGVGEEEFISKYGFGVATMYTGVPPQLATGYSPAKVGLGERNVEIFLGLSSADQVAYNRALFGDDPDATLATGIETENFSRCGGCTRSAIESVFTAEQMEASYYNPMDAMINDDPRMKKALREYAKEMRAEGFGYDHPDDVESDIRERLDAVTAGRTIPVSSMSPDQLAALEELRDYERRVAALNFELAEEIFDPVEERIQKELFARDVK